MTDISDVHPPMLLAKCACSAASASISVVTLYNLLVPCPLTVVGPRTSNLFSLMCVFENCDICSETVSSSSVLAEPRRHDFFIKSVMTGSS